MTPPAPARHVRVRVPAGRPRRWHLALLHRITAVPGHTVEADPATGPDGWPAAADLLFALETLTGGLPRTGPSTRVSASEFAAFTPTGAAPDVVVDLVGDVRPDAGTRVLRVAYDGVVGDAALLSALAGGTPPVVTLVEGRVVQASARPGSEVPGLLREALEDTVTGVVGLVATWCADGSDRGPAGTGAPAPPLLTTARLGDLAARRLAQAVVARGYHLCFHAPHWRVGWRTVTGPDVVDTRDLSGPAWHDLADDGRRFYADPFPIVRAGRTWLFVEEFVHATGTGLVSAVEFDARGPVGVPRPVLAEPHHLSYPFVFEHGGETWLLPEGSTSGRLDLYRATAFPGGWVREATLLTDVVASDATLTRHGGRWWLFATVRDAPAGAPLGRGSWSDALHLWSAPDVCGPWTPHPRNPVVLDVAAARPAGATVLRDGVLIRPVQDCRTGYGRALGLVRVDRLTPEDYAQTPLATVTAGGPWPGSRVHTRNRAGALEVIDGSARAPRLTAMRRWPPARRP